MAFDGLTGALRSTATVNLAPYSVVTVEWWQKDFVAARQAFETSTNFNSNNGAFLLYPNTSTQFSIETHDAGGYNVARCPITFSPSSGVWHHYVVMMFVGKAGSNILYLDSLAQVMTQGAAIMLSAFGNFTLYGASRATTSAFQTASMDEIAVYGAALSPGRIAAHYAARNFGPDALSVTRTFQASSG